MPRNISFALTIEQFKNRSKMVTRRDGWENLKMGDELCAVVKSQGLKKSEKIEKLGIIRVKDIRREPLARMIDDIAYGRLECMREGFPSLWGTDFVALFCRSHRGCYPNKIITRIEYEYL